MKRRQEQSFFDHARNSCDKILSVVKFVLEGEISHKTQCDQATRDELEQLILRCSKIKHRACLQEDSMAAVKREMKLLIETTIQNKEPATKIIDEVKTIGPKFKSLLDEYERQRPFCADTDPNFVACARLLRNNKNLEEPIDEDFEIMTSEQFIIPVDPISKRKIQIPVRNKKCNHVYDKESFESLFKFKPKDVKCPMSGCQNRHVTLHQVEVDEHLKAQIDRARLEEEDLDE